MNVGLLLRSNAVRFPQKDAIVEGQRRVSYRELNQTANKLANTLLSMNVSKGDKAAVYVNSPVEFAQIYFALSKIGTVIVPINYRIKRKSLSISFLTSDTVLLFFDEKSQLQALDRTQPELPLRPGNPKRLTATYKRNGTTCLIACLSVHDGEVTGRCVDRNNHDTFLNFLKHLYRKYPGKGLHIIMDNLSLHKHKEVMNWVNKRRRLAIHFTPTHASWLSQIEIWFNIFSRDVIRGGVWKSKRQMINQIMHYIKYYTEHRAHPFKWTYTGKPLVA